MLVLYNAYYTQSVNNINAHTLCESGGGGGMAT